MKKIMHLLFTLPLSTISVAPVYAGQRISLATAKASNKTVNNTLLEIVQKKETSSDDIFALIAKGADVNTTDTYGNTPLNLAASSGLAAVCLTLIASGADVNVKDKKYCWTPLVWAANHGLREVCLALLDRGADVDATNHYDNTAFSWAANRGHRDVCILLLRHMLLQQLLTSDPDGGDLSTRKMRMKCAILTLRRNGMNKDLTTLIIESKPLMLDYTACRYDTYHCRFRLNEHPDFITKGQLYEVMGQSTIYALKAAMQHAYSGNHTTLKNLLNPIDFDEHFDKLFLKFIPLKPTLG